MSPLDPSATKLVVITGASSGLGLATAQGLAGLGYRVVMVCRDRERGEAARVAVAAVATGPPPELLLADLSSQAEIRRLSAELHRRYEHIDVLINNAGASFSAHELTVDGIERTLAVNHLAPFLLTTSVLDLVDRSPAGRIVVVSSETHSAMLDFDNLQGEKSYNFFRAYTRSKLANILFAYELARRERGTRVTVNALSPGPAKTRFGDNMRGLPLRFSRLMKSTPLFKAPEIAARTAIYLASSPEVDGVSGKFFMQCTERRTKPITHDEAVAARLWSVSEALTAPHTGSDANVAA